MVTFAIGYFIVTTFIIVERPTMEGIIKDWGQIYFWPDVGGTYAAVSPKGCFSPTCTSPILKEGTATIDRQNREIHLKTRFVLAETSRFPLPCVENCSGGGTVQLVLKDLMPNDYAVWFRDEKVGTLKIFSGLPTPRQCFERSPEES
jgi:hypothetical protein